MQRIRKINRWLFGPNEDPHRVIASWIYVAFTIVISLMWQNDSLHHYINTWCGYRGDKGGALAPVRLVTSAFLVPYIGYLTWGCLGLLVALPALERRVGAHHFIAIIAIGHIVSTTAADLFAAFIGHTRTLHNLDVGSSVVMVTDVAALAIVTRSWKVWAFLIWGLVIDTITLHTQSTAEHYIGASIGISLTLLYTKTRRLVGARD